MSISKKTKNTILNSAAVSFIAYHLLNLYSKTVRVRFENFEALTEHMNKGGRVLIGSWHQRFFGGFYIPKRLGRKVCIMISQSRDGSFISDVVERIGWMPVRGSRTRGGKEALKGMIEGMKKTHIGGHIVDGPTGPPHIIKPGLISIAQQTGSAITPAYVIYENPFIFNSWDHFMVPKPFSRVLLRFGPLVTIPPEMSEAAFEDLRRSLEETMIEEYERLDPSVRV